MAMKKKYKKNWQGYNLGQKLELQFFLYMVAKLVDALDEKNLRIGNGRPLYSIKDS